MDKAEISKNRRYKKPALADMSYDDIIMSLILGRIKQGF